MSRADDLLLRHRLTNQLLAGDRMTTPEAVVERLLAVQGQDFRGFRLAVRARASGLHSIDVHRALDERTLVVTWLNRGTLHLVRAADYAWLHALLAPPLLTIARRRLEQEGLAVPVADQAVQILCSALREHGPLVRAQVRELLTQQDIAAAGQALVFVLYLAAQQGLIVRGPVVGAEQAYVLVADWLGPQPRVDREQALARLARRYLAGHGPARDTDLAYWTGLPLRDARAGLAALQLDPYGDGLVDLPGREPPARLPRPVLLGSFDPVLHGWASRDLVAGDAEGVVTTNGIFRPSLLVHGRVAGIWAMPGGTVEMTPLAELSDATEAALQRDARRVEKFLS